MDKVTATRLTGGNPGKKRSVADYYPTPADVTQAQNFEMLLKEREEKRLQMPKEDADGILIGGTYRHFKGKEYVAMAIAEYMETGEPMVIYGDEHGKIWARQKRDFLSIVNRNGQKYRFELVEDEA